MIINPIIGAMGRAWEASKLSPCLKKKVGAVLMHIKTGVVLQQEYGRAVVPCSECVRKKLSWTQDGCWSIHAETRLISNCNCGSWYDLKDCCVVVTHGPCDQCLKYMHWLGVPAVIYDEPYKTDYTKWEDKINICPYQGILELFESGYETDLSLEGFLRMEV